MFEQHHELVWRNCAPLRLRRGGRGRLSGSKRSSSPSSASTTFVSAAEPRVLGRPALPAFARRSAASEVCALAASKPRWTRTCAAWRGSTEARARMLQLLDLALSHSSTRAYSRVFVLFDIGKAFPRRRFGQALGIPTGTVAPRLRRARAEVRAVAQRLESIWKREEGGR